MSQPRRQQREGMVETTRISLLEADMDRLEGVMGSLDRKIDKIIQWVVALFVSVVTTGALVAFNIVLVMGK